MITIDFETHAIRPRPHGPPQPVGVSIMYPGETPHYYAFGHLSGGNNCTEREATGALMRVWESGLPVLCHNARFDLSVAVERWGLPMLPWQRIHDTMFLIFLLDPHARTTALKPLAEDMLGMAPEERGAVSEWVWEHRARIAEVTGAKVKSRQKTGAHIWCAPGDLVGAYANGDVVRTKALYDHMRPLVARYGMDAAYDRERRLLPILMANERAGLRVATEALSIDIRRYGAAFDKAEVELRRMLGSPDLNFDADKDVAEVLLNKGIVPEDQWSTTKTGQLSMAKDNMHPDQFTGPGGAVVASLLGYRNRLATCLKMFMRPWMEQAAETGGTIHTNWHQTRSIEAGGTRCMPAGELVFTSRGCICVEDVRAGDKVLSHTGEAREVLAAFDNGVKQVGVVHLDSGLSLRVTGNHQFRTLDGWRRADELAPGDQVVVACEPEQWASIADWAFAISSWGRVRNTETGKIRKLNRKGRWGHLKVTLKERGRKADFAVHRLVVNAFNPGQGEVRHLNGIAWFNTVDNLTWGSSSDNRQDALRHGTMWVRRYGETKLDEAAVARIRALPIAERGGGGGPTNDELAVEYGVNERLIRAVRNGERWPDIVDHPRPNTFRTARVVSSAPTGAARTYGLEVAVDHSHVTGGIVTHNTGRPSTSDHNFLNLAKSWTGRDDGYQHPVFLDLPELPLVRRYVLPDDGCTFVHRDFSGQELRIFAHFEQGALHAEYQRDPRTDPHAVVAVDLTRVSGRDFTTPEMRPRTKTLNFQGLYGGGIPALQRKLRCTNAEAREMKAFHDEALPGRKILVEEIKRCLRRGLPVRTIGDRLYFAEPPGPDGRSKDYKLINYIIQGSAADSTKQTIIDWDEINSALPDGRRSRFLVSVYDEINISAPKHCSGDAMRTLREVMNTPRLGLTVPMLSDGKWGPSWGDLTKVKDEELFA